MDYTEFQKTLNAIADQATTLIQELKEKNARKKEIKRKERVDRVVRWLAATEDYRRHGLLDSSVRIIQRRFRTFIFHKGLAKIKSAADALQVYLRDCWAKSVLAKKKNEAAITIQKHVRRWLSQRAFLKLRSSAQVLTPTLSSLAAKEAAVMNGSQCSGFITSSNPILPLVKRPKLEKPTSQNTQPFQSFATRKVSRAPKLESSFLPPGENDANIKMKVWQIYHRRRRKTTTAN